MTIRALLAVCALSLVLAPGCELVTIPLKILDGLASVLFFWAGADAAGSVPVVPPGEALADSAPVPLREALDGAIALDATGQAWVVPEGAPIPDELLANVPPGGVLVAVRVLDEELPDGLRERLEDRGIRVRRPDGATAQR